MKRESATQMGVISRTECNSIVFENAVEIPYVPRGEVMSFLERVRKCRIEKHGGSRPSLLSVIFLYSHRRCESQMEYHLYPS